MSSSDVPYASASEEPPVEDLDDLDPVEAKQIAAAARDAEVRHAPRFGVFVTVGIVLGAIVGFVVTKVVGAFEPAHAYSGTVAVLTALAGAVAGGIIAGLLALRAERRS